MNFKESDSNPDYSINNLEFLEIIGGIKKLILLKLVLNVLTTIQWNCIWNIDVYWDFTCILYILFKNSPTAF